MATSYSPSIAIGPVDELELRGEEGWDGQYEKPETQSPEPHIDRIHPHIPDGRLQVEVKAL